MQNKSNNRGEYNVAVYWDICNSITKEFREKLYGELVEPYKHEKEKQENETHDNAEKTGYDRLDKERGNTPFRREK